MGEEELVITIDPNVRIEHNWTYVILPAADTPDVGEWVDVVIDEAPEITGRAYVVDQKPAGNTRAKPAPEYFVYLAVDWENLRATP